MPTKKNQNTQPRRKSAFHKEERGIEASEEEAYASKKRERLLVPLTFYYVADLLREFVNSRRFPDSLLSVFAMVSVAIAFPFYPVLILIPLIIIVFILTRLHPLAGLMGLLFLTFPMIAYQAPLLGWLYLIVVAVSLYVGYRNTDTITVSYALIVLPFSYLGYIVEIPAFMMSVLYLGFKRSLIVATMVLIFIPMVAGLTGIHNTSPVYYNQAGFRASISGSPLLSMLSPSGKAPGLSSFPSALAVLAPNFLNLHVSGNLGQAVALALQALWYDIELTGLQLVIWLVVIFAVTNHVIKSRGAYKGSEASIYAGVLLLAYMLLSYASGAHANVLEIFGFIITPPLVFALELNDVNIVRALDVMKRDFLGSFGEAFEDLTSGAHETLKDIGDYLETKKELTEAILEPIEHKEIVGAYHIKPAKGILLFGPPGVGKTLMMRALSNEIRARFFYVKSSTLGSSSKDSVQMLSKIFDTAKKHAPAVLFFDEIDGIAGKRESQSDDSSRRLLTVLLSEMDGFQRLDGVVIVGSTNVPHLLDPGIMRPGRFDKIIYVPLPDKNARMDVFKYYSTRYPMSSDIDFEKLASLTQRFSNADIANVCAEAARHVAEVALRKAQILKIDTDDMVRVIRAVKPSTSLGRLAEYERFRMDYERRLYKEEEEGGKNPVSIDDVVGLDDAKKALYEALEVPILHPALAKEYDVGDIRGVLLFGPPGVGKTMLMNAVAREVGEYKMIRLSGADLVRQGYENAVETIAETFNRAAENSPAIIFIDEVDSLVPKRDSGSATDTRITAEFLKEFDNLRNTEKVILVGTTNRPESMDSAMIRPGRFDKLIYVGRPGKDERIDLFRKNLEKTVHDDIDFEKLAAATKGYTGADIVNVCREAKMQALENKIASAEEQHITTSELLEIIKRSRPSAPDTSLDKYQTFLYLHGRA